MNLLNPAIAGIAKLRYNRIADWINNPEESQFHVFQHLIYSGQYTEYGRKYGFRSVFTREDYRGAVPIVSYEDLQPFIQRMMDGDENVLWNEPVYWYAKSSGTTSSKSKFIPMSTESLQDNHYQANKDVLALYYNGFPDTALLTGKGLVVGGSHQISSINEEIQYGDLSAVLMQNSPFWGQWLRTPELSIAIMDNWNEKIEALAQATSVENVTSIAGVPTWTLILLKRILEITGKKTIAEVWPDIELYLNGGVSFTPYREQFEQIFGKKVNFLEVYNASEGFFAAQQHPDDDGLLLYTDHAIYYEFMPIGEYGKANPETFDLRQVETGRQYAMIITTSGGLWRYLIGDTVMFTSLAPYRLKVTGRLKHYINTFGEELIIDNADAAMAAACAGTDASITDYTAAPVFFSEQSNGTHEWLIEFEKEPADLNKFVTLLDDTLKKVNSDYEAKRFGDIALSRPRIHKLPKGAFNQWLDSKNKLGGQHKVPRLSNDRVIMEELKEMFGIA